MRITIFFVFIITLGVFWPYSGKTENNSPEISCLSNLSSLGHFVLLFNKDSIQIKSLNDLLEYDKGMGYEEFECSLKRRIWKKRYYFFGYPMYTFVYEHEYRCDYVYLYNKCLNSKEPWIICYCLNHNGTILLYLSNRVKKIVSIKEFDLLFEKQKEELFKNGIKCSKEQGILNE